ncbi:hypothetical protein P7L91_00340 [Bisgaard Taxon 10/6]|uniref:hypothetical protein n=1 Tax=Exercitatus varius TaxID=67857 RepID=UPI00294B02DD|nr:hypothetical protein [Exercitatus varius]MDG2959297.1 hypothetical protein [Exercitatus varius]
MKRFLCVIASAITYGFATVGKANVQKALLFVTALFSFAIRFVYRFPLSIQ